MSNIYNYTEVSKVLTSNPKQVVKGYSGKKYKEAINELIDFQVEWIKKWGKNKTPDVAPTNNKSANILKHER